MAAPREIVQLIERFERNRSAYESAQYNETQLRREFVDPFFEALGWDIENKQGYAEAYKDVIHEDAIKIGGATKAPDYCFRIGGVRKFFLEAKKPSVNVKEDISPAYQLRRYAWSAKLPLSILTDFEEFAVYDCRIKPDVNDKASTARVMYLTCDEYLDKWDEIAATFSKEAVLRGSFDKYAESHKAKRGTAEVDAAFLKEIESWRDALAKNVALRNPDLSQRDLNFAVQRTIDRLIFLRMCEDRGIEMYGRLLGLLNGSEVYTRLGEFYRQADDRYNSGLFHFHAERERVEPPDELTPGLTIDDKPLKEIIRGLYYPDSPYEFSVLPTEILGQVYEQFLGKVIRLTAGHRAVVEDKPEVKKAGGVYYTPAYIVDYIVRNTVGKLVEGNTPKQVAKLRILDPACGSGSFLVGAYHYLLDWHRDWYVNDGPDKHMKAIYQGRGGLWYLTSTDKKRILLNNIYGVDIDPQAVEVTKLSLLLKVLEGESGETLKRQLSFARERALPDLGRNIKCGNSLIGPDFFNGYQFSLFDENERLRVNIFDWQAEFPAIMKGGGFDAVIGNPPYIRIQIMRESAAEEVDYFRQKYEAAASGNYDIYVVFVDQGLRLLNRQGTLGFILPHKFFNAQYGEPLRGVLAAGRHLASIVHFGHQQVFAGATTYTCLLFLTKAGSDKCRFIQVNHLDAWMNNGGRTEGSIPAKAITEKEWNFHVGDGAALLRKLSSTPIKLGDVAERMAQGIRTSANEVYVLDLVRLKRNRVTAHSTRLDIDVELERGAVAMFLQGKEIKPYRIIPSGKLLLFPYQIESGRATLLTEHELKEQFPKAHAYLLRNKDYLRRREKGRFRATGWYGYGRVQNIELMSLPKILVPDIADKAAFALDEAGEYAFTSGYGITLHDAVQESPKYILGLLNSKVLDFYLKRVSTTLRGGFFRYFTQFIEQLPIRRISFVDRADKARHDRMVEFVEQMLSLHKQLAAAKTPHAKENLQRQIEATDRQIDQMVYELYGLTEEDVRLVE